MRLIFVFTGIVLCLNVWGQKPSEYAYLKEKYAEYDYVVLNDETSVEISKDDEKGIKMLKHVHLQVYLTSDRAGLYKNDRIYSSYFEQLLDKEAYALNQKTGKDAYKKEKVKYFNTEETISEEVFFDDGTVTSFQYEGLKENSILNVEYTVELRDPHLSVSGFFAASYPLLHKSLKITVEDGIKLTAAYFNMDSTDANYQVTHEKKSTVYQWKQDTLEIYKKEHSSPNVKYYLPHAITRIAYYYDESGEKIGVLEGVEDLHNWYVSLINQVKCESPTDLEKVIEEIISEDDTELQKVRKVFKWVQDNVKYIAIEDGLGGFIPRDPDLVMSRRYGDCKDMATLIVQLLEMQDIPAHQVWIGTTAIPYEYEEIPSPVVDNHMIAAYYDKENEEYIFLDATDNHIAFGYPTQFIQGKQALVNTKDGYEIVEVPRMTADKTQMTDTATVFIDGDRLGGNGSMMLSGYYASDFKHMLSRAKNEQGLRGQVEYVTKKGSNKYHLGEYKIDKKENAIFYEYEFSIPSYVNYTEDEIYVNLSLDLFLDFFEPYEVDDRETDVTERYATETRYSYTLEIPEGYEIDYVPENLFVDGGDEFYVKINYDQSTEGEVIYSFELWLDYILLPVDRVAEMEKLGKKLKQAYKETIILKKVSDNE